MSEELKPCPFCGKQPDFIDFHSRDKVYVCRVDGDHDVRVYGKTKEGAATNWKRRIAQEQEFRRISSKARAALHKHGLGGAAIDEAEGRA